MSMYADVCTHVSVYKDPHEHSRSEIILRQMVLAGQSCVYKQLIPLQRLEAEHINQDICHLIYRVIYRSLYFKTYRCLNTYSSFKYICS